MLGDTHPLNFIHRTYTRTPYCLLRYSFTLPPLFPHSNRISTDANPSSSSPPSHRRPPWLHSLHATPPRADPSDPIRGPDMGKGGDEEDRRVPGSSLEQRDSGSSAAAACGRFFRPRCVLAVVLGAAVLLSAVFWLPPFVKPRGDRDGGVTANIVASFRLQRPVAQLRENLTKLESDIFDEIGYPGTVVVVSSLDPVPSSNWTIVVFGIWPYPSNSTLTRTCLSILHSSLTSLAIQQWTFHLTPSLFGNSSYFQIEKFPGGITVTPPQSAYTMQNPNAVFNFSLNFPICTLQGKLDELKNQMRLGLYLTSYENLYVKLTNLEGSTIAPPTIVQMSIILAVGSNQPRMKQLAQTISNSSDDSNLGLNNTVFGKVKQVRLSSFLQHTLNTGQGAPSPAPVPEPNSDHHHHHHHHHNHHHHHHHSHDHDHHHHGHHQKHQGPAPAPVSRGVVPSVYKNAQAPSSPVVSVAPPLRSVVLGSAQPPVDNMANGGTLHAVQSIAPAPSAAMHQYNLSLLWPLVLLLYHYWAFL